MSKVMTPGSLDISDDVLFSATDILGISIPDQPTLIDTINNGFNAKTLKLLQSQMAFKTTELSQRLNISTSTLYRRKAYGKLKPDESMRMLLIASMLAAAIKVLENHASALNWLKSANKTFNGLSPLEYAETVERIENVINLLHKIEYGVFI